MQLRRRRRTPDVQLDYLNTNVYRGALSMAVFSAVSY